MMLKQPSKILFISGGTVTIIGAVAQLLDLVGAPYIFSFGAAFLVYNQFLQAWKTDKADMRQQRLSRIAFFTSLLLALAAYFMFTNSTLWVLAVLIYALSSFALSFRGE